MPTKQIPLTDGIIQIIPEDHFKTEKLIKHLQENEIEYTILNHSVFVKKDNYLMITLFLKIKA